MQYLIEELEMAQVTGLGNLHFTYVSALRTVTQFPQRRNTEILTERGFIMSGNVPTERADRPVRLTSVSFIF